jgi:hypothetical protein
MLENAPRGVAITTMPRRTLERLWREDYRGTDAHYREYATFLLAKHVKLGGDIAKARPMRAVLLAKIDRAAQEYERSLWLYGNDHSDAIPPNPITYPLWMHLAFDAFGLEPEGLRA